MRTGKSPTLNPHSQTAGPASSSRIEKLFRLALDAAAADGEIVQACRALQRIAKEAGDDPLKLVLAAKPKLPDARLPFGKHRGELLSVVFEEDPDYIEWFYENIQPRGRRLAEALEFWRDQLSEAA